MTRAANELNASELNTHPINSTENYKAGGPGGVAKLTKFGTD